MGRPAENKHKKRKKGRPSLLDLQKRSLRLQQQQHLQNPNPNPKPGLPNPYVRFPPRRRDPTGDDEDAEEDEEGAGRKEKKLNLVLRMPESSGSEGEGRRRDRKRRIGDLAAVEKTENGKSKAGDSAKGVPPFDAENGTPLPDKKLLVFILDRLQKKDTYGVFSEPVDPEELPDYHDIIENPMDFGTIRKKLTRGAYANLEQFEKDVFLISLNAMRYNASDTVYFRQARSIQELAKKDFQNLRQESDDDEPEQKTTRRGRPSTKNAFKKPLGRPASERASSNNSDAVLLKAPENVNVSKSLVDAIKNNVRIDEPGQNDLSNKTSQLPQTSENCSWFGYQKAERNEEFPGSTIRGMVTRHGKKDASEENRRNTYMHSSVDSFGWEPSILTTFDGEKKELVPVGLHIGYAYARSLSRFAAALGPIAWEIAAKRIEKALPPGMNFGRGWIGEQDVPPQSYQPRLLSVSSSSDPSSTVSPSTMMPSAERALGKSGPSLNLSTSDKAHPAQIAPLPSVMHPISKKSPSPSDAADGSRIASHVKNLDAHDNILSVSSQPHEDFAELTTKDEYSTPGLNTPPSGPLIRLAKSTESAPTDLPVTLRQLPETVLINRSSSHTRSASASHAELERARFSSPCAVNSFNSFFHPPSNRDQGTERTKLQRLGNAADSAHPSSASHMEADLRQLGKPGATGPRSCFSHPIAGGQSDMEKSNNLDTIDGGNGSVQFCPAVTNHVEAEVSKVGCLHTVNNGMNSIRPAAISQSITEITDTSNSDDLTGKGLSQPASSNHISSRMPKLGNPRMLRAISNFADPAVMGNEAADKARPGGIPNTINSCRNLPGTPQDPQGSWSQVMVHQKSDSTPDLNVRFQSTTSPPSGMVVDSQHPDLMLQL